MAGTNSPYRYPSVHCAANATTACGAGALVARAAGDYLHRVVVTVNTAASSLVQIKDGSHTHTLVPNAIGSGIGCYPIELNMISSGAGWTIITGAGSEVEAVGIFSAA